VRWDTTHGIHTHHPGEILADELQERRLSPANLADAIEMPPDVLHQILAGQRDIHPDTALRLARFSGTSTDLWMNMQRAYESESAAKQNRSAL